MDTRSIRLLRVKATEPDNDVGFQSKLTVTSVTNLTADIMESSRKKALKQIKQS